MGKCISSPKYPNRDSTLFTTEQDEEIPDILSGEQQKKLPMKSDKLLISNALKSHYLFSSLNGAHMEILFKRMKFYTIESNETVFEQGAAGKMFYIIASGKVEVWINGHKKVVLHKEDSFGEMALLTNSIRRATIKTAEKTTLWAIGRANFKAALKLIYSSHYEENKKFISNLQLFSGLTELQKASLTEAAVLHDYQDNARVICEGDEGLLLFIVKQGSAVAKKLGIEYFRIFEGEMFGEAVVFDVEKLRMFSVFSVGRLQCLSIAKDSIVSIIGENFKEILYKTRAKNALSTDILLCKLQQQHLLQIVEEMKWNFFEPGDIVFPQRKMRSRLFVICSGAIRSESYLFNNGEVFGLENDNHMIKEEFTADTEVILGCIKNRDIEKITKTKIKFLKKILANTNFLCNVEIISDIGLSKLQYLASKIIFKEYDAREMIYKYNDKSEGIFIIKKGSVEIFHEGKLLRILGKYDIFGENCIEENLRFASARTLSNVLCIFINQADFHDIIDEYLDKKLHFRKSLASKFTLHSIILVNSVYKSQFKASYFASLGDPQAIFYVSVIVKSLITSEDYFSKLVQEKTIAISTEHHFLLRFLKYFSEKDYLYLVYEYIPSVPLISLLNRPLLEDHARFLTACIVIILEYFDKKELIYRDLCPDNFLVNAKGYLILKNYSSAKITRLRTYTLLGNPCYNAPEMIMGKGYTKSVDYWSLGVIIYELLHGKHPFQVKPQDTPIEIAKKILDNPLDLPDDSDFLKANSLLSKLLAKEPRDRIGLNEIKYSKWLNPVDWSRINSESDISPCKPDLSALYKRSSKEFKQISLQKIVNVSSI